MMERIDGMLPRLVAGLRDRSYPLLPAHCLQVRGARWFCVYLLCFACSLIHRHVCLLSEYP